MTDFTREYVSCIYSVNPNDGNPRPFKDFTFGALPVGQRKAEFCWTKCRAVGMRYAGKFRPSLTDGGGW